MQKGVLSGGNGLEKLHALEHHGLLPVLAHAEDVDVKAVLFHQGEGPHRVAGEELQEEVQHHGFGGLAGGALLAQTLQGLVARRGKGSSGGGGGEKKEKDPNAPKRPTTSYIFYMKEKRDSVVAENPSATLGEVGKTVGAMWSALSAAEKKPYEELAAKDKKRYEAETKAYKPKVRGWFFFPLLFAVCVCVFC